MKEPQKKNGSTPPVSQHAPRARMEHLSLSSGVLTHTPDQLALCSKHADVFRCYWMVSLYAWSSGTPLPREEARAMLRARGVALQAFG